MASSTSLATLIFLFANCVLALPSKDGAKLPAENLKFTFGSADDVPAAFSESGTPTSDKTEREGRRIQYPACQDGSGGLCVTLGKCPSGFKVEKPNALACKASQECCYKVPDDEKSCQARGGQCLSKSRCGKAPLVKEATDCNLKNDEVCCVLV